MLLGLGCVLILNKNNHKKDSLEVPINKKVNNNINKKQEESIDEEIINNNDSSKPNNEDIVGRVSISGTNIDEYIVQGVDNDYYLNNNLNKEEDILGSVFLDYRNSFDDRKLLLFGHNARKLKDAPFHDLEYYIDESYYSNHKYISLK